MAKKISGISKFDEGLNVNYVERRGRLGKDELLFLFDVRKYKADVNMALKNALVKIRKEMILRMKMRLTAIPFRNRSISLADGSKTTDIERKAALIESIAGSRIDGNLRDGVMRMSVTAMEDNFQDSHVGFYYEYGTGTQEESESPHYLWGDWNPYRGAQIPGQPILTRKAGFYLDAGGNTRVSYSKNPGMPITTPGWEIEAHSWFRSTFDSMLDTILDELKEALYKVNPLDRKYLKINPKLKINLVRKRG